MLDLISENISLEITYHALEWLELFTKFFSYEVKNKETVFLEPIFMGHFRKVLLVVLTSISD